MDEMNNIVKKSNDLIDKARYELTLTQQRLILYVITMIRTEDEDFKTYSIPVSKFMEITRGSDWLYHELKKEAKDLLKKPVEIPVEDGGFGIAPWFSYFEYLPKQGIVRVSFDPHLKPYLLQLKERYTAYQLKCVLPMRSTYSIRVYEYLKQYEKFGYRKFDLEEFKKHLKIENKPSFAQYGHIKSRILTPAIRDINKFSDLFITKIVEHKVSRKVDSFTIYFRRKEDILTSQQVESQPVSQQSQSVESIPQQPEPKIEQKRHDISSQIEELAQLFPKDLQNDAPVILESWLAKYSYEDVRDAILYTIDQKPDRNFTGYVVRILRELPTSLIEYRSIREKKEKKEQKGNIQKKALKERAELESYWWTTMISEYKASLTQEELKELEEEVSNKAKEKGTNLETEEKLIIKRRISNSGIKVAEELTIEELREFKERHLNNKEPNVKKRVLTVKSFKTAITVAVSLHKAKPEMYIEIKSDDDYELDLNLVVCTNPTYKGVVIEIGENGEEIFEQYVGKEYSEWQKIAKLAYNYLFE